MLVTLYRLDMNPCDSNIDNLINHCQIVSDVALLGCQDQALEQTNDLIDKIINFAKSLPLELYNRLKLILNRLFDARLLNDLNQISDCVNYELISFLQQIKKA